MADLSTKAALKANFNAGGTNEIKNNTTQDITGARLNAVLNNIVDTMGLGINPGGGANSVIRKGSSATASGNNSMAIGQGSTASGTGAIALGAISAASGANSLTAGADNEASGDRSVAEGVNTKATGNNSHAEGFGCVAGPTGATQTGASTAGFHSHAEGNGTKASGSSAHAEGRSTTASGESSHAEGVNNTASGNYSHAEGGSNTASGHRSHAEGGSNTASGDYSHAEGQFTQATNDYEHAEGYKNKSNKKTNGTPEENKKGSTLHSVGIGSSTQRINAFEIMQNGDAYLKGAGGYDGTNPATPGVQDLATLLSSVPRILDLGNVSLTREGQGTAPSVWGADAWAKIKTGKYGFLKGKDTIAGITTDVIVAITRQGYDGGSADPEEEDTFVVQYIYQDMLFWWRGDVGLYIGYLQVN